MPVFDILPRKVMTERAVQVQPVAHVVCDTSLIMACPPVRSKRSYVELDLERSVLCLLCQVCDRLGLTVAAGVSLPQPWWHRGIAHHGKRTKPTRPKARHHGCDMQDCKIIGDLRACLPTPQLHPYYLKTTKKPPYRKRQKKR